jgi:hypothetical protein
MARWIDLDSLDANTALWIMPEELIRFDQRDPPWPNRFWPWAYWFETAHPDFTRDNMIAMRRWFERALIGDVVVRLASEVSYNDFAVIYVDNAEDAHKVWDEWADWIVRVEEPLP